MEVTGAIGRRDIQGFAADGKFGALGAGDADVLADLVELRFMRERTDLRRSIKGITDDRARDALLHGTHKRVVHRTLDEHPRAAHAKLSAIEESRLEDRFREAREIR